MKRECPRYTLRVSAEILYKLGYIADFEGRTKNREIEFLLKKQIDEFEKVYGEIFVPSEIADD